MVDTIGCIAKDSPIALVVLTHATKNSGITKVLSNRPPSCRALDQVQSGVTPKPQRLVVSARDCTLFRICVFVKEECQRHAPQAQ